jgi:hypothetical protein
MKAVVVAHRRRRRPSRRSGSGLTLLGAPSGILGMVSSTLGGIVGGAGRVVSGLTLAPYRREREREADRDRARRAGRLGSRGPGRLPRHPGARRRSCRRRVAWEAIAQVIAREGAAWSSAQAAAANGVALDRPLERDWPVMVALAERYRPATGGWR